MSIVGQLSAVILACAPRVGMFPRLGTILVHFPYPALKAQDFCTLQQLSHRTLGRLVTKVIEHLILDTRLEMLVIEPLSEHMSDRCNVRFHISGSGNSE